MKSLRKSSAVFWIVLFCFCTMLSAFFMSDTFSITANAEEAADLTGFWKTEDKDGTWLEMYIDGDTVSVYWAFNDGDENAVYWIGTYTQPEGSVDEYSWVSERDAEKTDEASLASGDDSKDFTYSDGAIIMPLRSFGIQTTQYFYPAEMNGEPEEPPFEMDGLTADATKRQNASDAVRNYVTPEFEEQTLVDNDECTVIATGLEADSYDGYVLYLYLENKSDEINYTFAVRNGAVNGLDGYGYLDEMLDPGESREEDIEFDSISDYGITNVTDINLDLRVYDSDDWSAEIVNEDIHIYPLGEDNIVKYERESQDSDIVLADNEYATIIATGFEGDASSDYQIDVFLINKTNETVWFTAEDASINGCKMNPNFSYTITAGNCAYGKIKWRADDLEENNISEVSEIEMTLKVYADDEYSGDGFLNETVTVNP